MKFFKRFSINKAKLKSDKKGCEPPKEATEVVGDSTAASPANESEVVDPGLEKTDIEPEAANAPDVNEAPKEDEQSEPVAAHQLVATAEPETAELPLNADVEEVVESKEAAPIERKVDTTVTEDAVETETMLSPLAAATEAAHNAAEAAQTAAQSFIAAISQTFSTTFNPPTPTKESDAPTALNDDVAEIKTADSVQQREHTAKSEAPAEDSHESDEVLQSKKTPKSSGKKSIFGLFKGLRQKKQKEDEIVEACKDKTESNEDSIEVPVTEETPAADPTESPASPANVIANSFSIASVASNRSSTSKKSFASKVSKTFSHLSTQKSKSFAEKQGDTASPVSVSPSSQSRDDYDIAESKSTASAQSEISGLVRYMSHRENVERGFEVLLEDFDGFNKIHEDEQEDDAEEAEDDSVAQLLDDAEKVVSQKTEDEERDAAAAHDDEREKDIAIDDQVEKEVLVNDNEVVTEVATTTTVSKPDPEVVEGDEEDEEEERREFIPPQLSMRSNASKASRKSISSRLSRRKSKEPKEKLEEEGAKPESVDIPKAESSLSHKTAKSVSTSPEAEIVQQSASTTSHKSVVSKKSTTSRKSAASKKSASSRKSASSKKSSSSTTSRSSKQLQKSASNVSKASASAPTGAAAAAQPEILALSKSSKSFAADPAAATQAPAAAEPAVVEDEVLAEQQVAVSSE